MNLFLISFLFLLVYKSKLNLRSFYDCLSMPTTQSIRAAAALIVVFHHLAQKAPSYSIGSLFFQRVGFLAVTIFFFYSGYGLMKSYRTKENYTQSFVQKRILTILLPYLSFVLIYWIAGSALNRSYTVIALLQSFINGYPIVTDSWFVIALLLFYVFFYLLMKIFRKNYLLIFFGSVFWAFGWIFLCKKFGFNIFWYNTIICLCLGILVALIEDHLIIWLRKSYIPVCFCAFPPFLLILYNYMLFGSNNLFVYWLLEFLTIVCLMLVTMKLQINNPILKFLGKISFELYLIHRLIMYLFRSSYINIDNHLLWSIVVVAVSLVCAYVLNMLFTKMNAILLRGSGK